MTWVDDGTAPKPRHCGATDSRYSHADELDTHLTKNSALAAHQEAIGTNADTNDTTNTINCQHPASFRGFNTYGDQNATHSTHPRHDMNTNTLCQIDELKITLDLNSAMYLPGQFILAEALEAGSVLNAMKD
ncbi:hypothetical protein DBV39_12405 [Orrella marina]|uniref:Uncharacterized protein n=1 Tax=Orrella marina TaxID=2163011 RepID=A0A2R4XKT7_9BURK|nr:hypothetical protein DBV39_12405 [Orrella marina]